MPISPRPVAIPTSFKTTFHRRSLQDASILNNTLHWRDGTVVPDSGLRSGLTPNIRTVVHTAVMTVNTSNWHQRTVVLAAVMPICRNAHRNSGGTHDAWAYFNGCITHLGIAPKCIGSFMIEDALKGREKPMTPRWNSSLLNKEQENGCRC